MTRSDCGSISDLGDGRWRVRISAGMDPVTGKRIRLSKTVRGTKRDALAMRTKLLMEVGQAGRVRTDMTLGDYIEGVYLPFKRQQAERGEYRLASYYSAESSLRTNLGALRGLKLGEVTPYLVERHLASLDTRWQAWSAFACLSAAMNQAEHWELIDYSRNPFHKLKKPKRPPSASSKPASAEQLMGALRAMRGHRYEAVVLLIAGCALRPSEGVARDWEDFDWERGVVRISSAFHRLQHGECVMAETKTRGSSAEVHIPRGYILDRLYEIACDGEDSPCMSGPIARTFQGGRSCGANVADAFRRVQEASCSGERILLKNLRHTQATLLVEHEQPLYNVSKRLRHTNFATTDSFYAKPQTTELDAAVARAYGDILESAMGESRARSCGDEGTQRVPNPWDIVENGMTGA